ncbi:hypothetical protein OSB04_023783 [Centaurea solstitialis]|uniref:Uncharacterized protein n=1 Tax=Centaurea solstitialis TaxID=347529 RepID=A0AA38SWM6_9ASTR|nr:hypothetical protein OSB04_023783 [Centaurea solstitialis]
MEGMEGMMVSKVPMLKPNEFDMWKLRIKQYMLLTDYAMWDIVENGPIERQPGEDGVVPPPRTDADRKIRQSEMKALSTLLLAIPNEYQHQFATCGNAKFLWEALEKRFARSKSSKRNQKAILKQQYENFMSSKNESMTQTFDRFNKLIGELATIGVKMDNDDLNRKFLRSLGEEWIIYTVPFRQNDNLDDKELDDLYNDLRVFEAEVEAKKKPIGYTHNTALFSTGDSTTNGESISSANISKQETEGDSVMEALFSSHVGVPLVNEDLDQIHADDLEGMDLKWQIAMITVRVNRFMRRTGRRNFGMKRDDRLGFDKSKVECYKCHGLGHFARECRGGYNQQQQNHQQNYQQNHNQNHQQQNYQQQNQQQQNALVSQEGAGFDWSDQAEESLQNQALMAKITETSTSEIPKEVKSKLCTQACLETVRKYKDHNQVMCDSIKKLEQSRRESSLVIANLEEQIKSYQANEVQFGYDLNYWNWEKKDLELKLSKISAELEKTKEELKEANSNLEKFSKSSKALEELLKSQVHDDLNTPTLYNNNYIPSTTDILEQMDRSDLPKEATEVDPLVNSDASSSKKPESHTPDTDYDKIPRNEKVSDKSHTKPQGKSHCTCQQNKEKGAKRGNQRNWNQQWAQKQGVDLNKINRPNPCFICCKSTHLAKHCYFNPVNQRAFNKNKFVGSFRTRQENLTKRNQSCETVENGFSKEKKTVHKIKPEKKNRTSKVKSVQNGFSKSVPTVKKVWVPKAAESSKSTAGNNSTASSTSIPESSTDSNAGKNSTASDTTASNSSNPATKRYTNTPILKTKYSSHDVPSTDYLLKLNRHMTGNRFILQDFKNFEGRHVAFGDNPNGGRIKGKGKISKDRMSFEDVYYVEQLRYNLQSVSQVCDKRYTWVYFLKTKDETSGLIKSFVTRVENQANLKVKVIRSDNGTEFKNSDINSFCDEKGIEKQYSAPRTPQHNGVAERRNRTLIEAARSLLADSKLPITFWVEAVNTACYVQNRVLVFKSQGKTPYELFKKKKPFIGFFKPFGCPYTILNTKSHLGKFESRSEEGFLVGYATQCKGYRVFHSISRIIEESDNVKCNEHTPNAQGPSTEQVSEVQTQFVMFPIPTIDPAEFCTNDDEEECEKTPHADTREEPKKAHDAMKDPSWIEAMQEELLQFVLQHDERGIVIKNKARLVAQAYTQEEGIDYDEVFAPVARIEGIRLFLAYASFKNFKVYQMDVKSAFLYGKIEEEVYVCQPPGFEDPRYPDRVYKLKRHCMAYIKHQGHEFEDLMHKKFKMSVIGELNFFLGLQVAQKEDGIFIHQSKYVKDILNKFGFTDVKPASTPMETHKHLTVDTERKEVDVHHYRSMIGSLMYLTTSRPDIMFAVCVCARFQVQPKDSHLQAVKRIFRYSKLGLWYPHDSPFDLLAYTNSDYGGANMDRKSTTGGCQFLGSRLVSWQCKKQTSVSTSTAEAEYIAAASCCSQVLWIQNQMLDYEEHNRITYLKKDKNNEDFHEIIDFLKSSHIATAITIDPPIYKAHMQQFWDNATTDDSNDVPTISSKVGGRRFTITEAKIRAHLQLDDLNGLAIPLDIYKRNDPSSKMFAFLRKPNKDFSGSVTPLFPTMRGVAHSQNEDSGLQPKQSSTPSEILPTSSTSKFPQTIVSSTPNPSLKSVTRRNRATPSSSVATTLEPTSPSLEHSPLEFIQRDSPRVSPNSQKVPSQEKEGHVDGKAQPTTHVQGAGQDRLNITKTFSTETQGEQSSRGPGCQETMGVVGASARQRTSTNTFNDPSRAGQTP